MKNYKIQTTTENNISNKMIKAESLDEAIEEAKKHSKENAVDVSLFVESEQGAIKVWSYDSVRDEEHTI